MSRAVYVQIHRRHSWTANLRDPSFPPYDSPHLKRLRSITLPLIRAAMMEAVARLGAETRPRVAIALKIDYTRQATRFGCSQTHTASGALWKSKVTGKYTRGRPR